MIALIDGDEIAYKVALQYQRQVFKIKDTKGNILWECFGTKAEAIESIGSNDNLNLEVIFEPLDIGNIEDIISNTINNILLGSNCDSCRIYLSGDNNFRYDFAKLLPYKGNRDGSNPPLFLQYVRSLLIELGAEFVDHLEADDLLSANNVIGETVICSTDKDLRTVPSINYNISKGLLSEITEDIARYNFWKQMLIGDSVDNIPSPYLLGEVTATKILDGLFGLSDFDYYQTIIPEYTKYLYYKDKDNKNYRTKWFNGQKLEDIFYEIGNLLWMRRTLDVNERWELPCQKNT
ncbi:exodeoxyribonuclease [Caudoviricetes sp.]|nr:exodeoxyribonuclease [Caudoviricetes sp.]